MIARPLEQPTPERLCALIGRARELERLDALTRSPRGGLITVSGPPGVGKSALLRVALAEREATIVDLTEAQDEADALSRIATALEVPLHGPHEGSWRERALSQLEDALSHRPEHILALDHVEHLRDALREALTRWMSRAGQVLVLGSRVAYGIDAEQRVELGPLQTRLGADREPSQAATLFMERAMLQASPEQLELVEPLVERLDGLPLAIELAAARARLLTPSQLLARLEGAARERHELSELAKLEAAIAMSWELLDEHERLTLQACALWRGGVSVSALEAQLDGLTPDALGTLEALEAHSLVEVRQGHEGEGARAHLLLSVRGFVQRQAHASSPDPRHERLIERMMEHVAAHAQRCHAQALGDVWAPAAQRLDAEVDNLAQALALATQRDRPERRAPLALGLLLARRRRHELERIPELVETLMALSEDQRLPEPLRVECLLAAIDQHALQWESRSSFERYRALLGQHERYSPGQQALYLFKLLSSMMEQHERLEQHEELLQKLLTLCRAQGLTYLEAHALQVAAGMQLFEGQPTRMAALAQESMELARHHGWAHLTARAQMYTAFAYDKLGRFEQAHALNESAILHFERAQNVVAMAHTLRSMIDSCLEHGRVHEAEQALRKLEPLGRRHGLIWARGFTHHLRGLVLIEQERWTDALIELERALLHFSPSVRPQMIVATQIARSQCADLLGDEALALACFEQARALADQLGSAFARVMVLGEQLRWALRAQDRAAAQAHMAQIEALAHGGDASYLKPYSGLSRCHLALYDYQEATAKHKARRAKAALGELLEQLGPLLTPPPGQGADQAPVARLFDLRLSMKLLRRQLPESLQRRLEVMMRDPSGEGIIVDLQGQSFRAPGEVDWVDMSSRHTPFRLLATLVEQRVEQPGQPLSQEELCARVWPDELIVSEAAHNRLYVTITTLRKAGLGALILHEQGGYLLDPRVPLFEA